MAEIQIVERSSHVFISDKGINVFRVGDVLIDDVVAVLDEKFSKEDFLFVHPRERCEGKN